LVAEPWLPLVKTVALGVPKSRKVAVMLAAAEAETPSLPSLAAR